MTPEQKETLKQAAKLVRQAQEKVLDINDPIYGRLDEVYYTLLDLTEDEI